MLVNSVSLALQMNSTFEREGVGRLLFRPTQKNKSQLGGGVLIRPGGYDCGCSHFLALSLVVTQTDSHADVTNR